MDLRAHPLMSYRGQRNWPPAWTWTGIGENEKPHGETGFLKQIHISIVPPDNPQRKKPFNHLYVYMDYREGSYVGCLIFDDAATCRQMGKILIAQCGRTIKEIGDLDLNHLL
jgi:hypothetical protein